MTAGPPGKPASREEIVAFVKTVRADPRRRDSLLPLLREDASLYAGLGTGEVERLRGFIMASFAETGLPDEALDAVLEELETGRHAYGVAGAARAIRGAHRLPASVPGLIERAIRRIRSHDDYVDLGDPTPTAVPGGRTAVQELEDALAGARSAPCCGDSRRPTSGGPDAGAALDLFALDLEDQDGARLSFGEFFSGRAGLLAFFYTRCMNPEKCPLTISKLARVALSVETAGPAGRIAIAGMSYDPEFDTSERLREYGESRGFPFSAHCRLLRTMGPFEPVRNRLSLGVGYGPATLNRHRLEILLLAPDGAIADYPTRRLWSEEAVAARLIALAG